MSQINTPPLGLQELLGSQNFGDNPKQLEGKVTPNLDLLTFYGAGLLRVERASGGAVGEGLVTAIEFANRAAIIGASIHYYNGLANAEYMALGIALSNISGDNPTEPTFIAENQWPNNIAVATSEPVLSTFLPYPLIVEPGVKVEAWQLSYFNSPADTLRLRVMYYDLGGV